MVDCASKSVEGDASTQSNAMRMDIYSTAPALAVSVAADSRRHRLAPGSPPPSAPQPLQEVRLGSTCQRGRNHGLFRMFAECVEGGGKVGRDLDVP